MWINADVDSDEQDMAMDILKGRSATNIKAEMESDLAFVLLLGTETTFWMKSSADPPACFSLTSNSEVQEKRRKFSLLFFIEELYYWSLLPRFICGR